MTMRKYKPNGFTLFELLIVIAIVGVLTAIAMPSYRSFIERQKVRSVLNQWQSSFYFAQREAMRTKRVVSFCGSSDGINCNGGSAHDFSNGWIVITQNPANPAAPFVLEDNTGDEIVKVSLNNAKEFSSNGIQFMSNGRIKNFATGTLTIYPQYPGENLTPAQITSRAKQLTISSGGRLLGVTR